MELPSTRLRQALPQDSLSETLETRGFSVIDNAFGEEWCKTIREEMDILFDSDLFVASKNKLSAEGENKIIGHVLDKPGIYELDMVVDGKVICKPEVFLLAENIKSLYEEEMPKLVEVFNRACPELELVNLDQMKLQINKGIGGCFPLHFDTKTEISSRHLTAILYLNEDWQPGNGGELRLYPLPYKEEDVAPKMDRLAIFCSHQMLHRVMPAKTPRYCFSLWFGSKSSTPFPSVTTFTYTFICYIHHYILSPQELNIN
eukprot:TRINITY_DN4114_c0_g1_i1.p1 TRINITY_DN4114_c0_g1~~TRINITY_DN4114_c0_g1_i1.p1  ORF type:complete len:259 (-),score=35.01 TRINITY_DN4114_c0_g1_i1:24-800(-)